MTLRPDGTVNGVNLVPLEQTLRAVRALGRTANPFQHPTFSYLLVNVGGNLAVFMPLGFGLTAAFQAKGAWTAFCRATFGGLLLSLAVELVQLAIPTRATDVDDVIFNTAGTAIGATACLTLLRLLRRPRREGTAVKGLP